jgi:hypothetical protein
VVWVPSSKPKTLKYTANVSEPVLCAVFRNFCSLTGCSEDAMLPDWIYVVAAEAFGTIGGVEISSPRAPVQHTLNGGTVVGFLPTQIDDFIGFRGYEGFSLGVKRKVRGTAVEYGLEVLLTEALVYFPQVIEICRRIERVKGSKKEWLAP